jgi:hypothetical protein
VTVSVRLTVTKFNLRSCAGHHTLFSTMLAATLTNTVPANAAETKYKHSVAVSKVDTPKPVPGKQVLVKIQAVSYNHR